MSDRKVIKENVYNGTLYQEGEDKFNYILEAEHKTERGTITFTSSEKLH